MKPVAPIEFTPGPWTCSSPTGDYGHGIIVSASDSCSCRMVAVCTGKKLQAMCADARLMASAPEMFQILDRIIRFEDSVKANDSIPTENWRLIIRDIERVVAKVQCDYNERAIDCEECVNSNCDNAHNRIVERKDESK